MTGHGEGEAERDGLRAQVEVRTVNNRYFKLVVRSSEGAAALESRLEDVIRGHIRRGVVHVNLTVIRAAQDDAYVLNDQVLAGYLRQLQAFCRQHGAPPPPVESLLALPGVASEHIAGIAETEGQWHVVEAALRLALSRLAEMRAREGAAMARDLMENCRTISVQLDEVAVRAPQVIAGYRQRLLERLQGILGEQGASLSPAEVVREAALFAERSDVSEEIVRLRSHVEQFLAIMQSPEPSGRKLEFITQEMFREANTIGSKANDAPIAQHVVEIKTAIERLREMVQNVE